MYCRGLLIYGFVTLGFDVNCSLQHLLDLDYVMPFGISLSSTTRFVLQERVQLVGKSCGFNYLLLYCRCYMIIHMLRVAKYSSKDSLTGASGCSETSFGMMCCCYLLVCPSARLSPKINLYVFQYLPNESALPHCDDRHDHPANDFLYCPVFCFVLI